MCIYVCIYMCIYIYTHTHIYRERENRPSLSDCIAVLPDSTLPECQIPHSTRAVPDLAQ